MTWDRDLAARAGPWVVVALLMVAALAVRIEGITDPPLDFRPTRQYRAAIIARGFYFAIANDVPQWRKEIALLNLRRQGALEPPIMEGLAAVGYAVIGAEQLWLPRLLSALFWVLGGAFLYLCARKLVAVEAALVSVAYYLFLPFAITASRSFQPDPLMVTALLLTLLLILRYDELPSVARFVSAATAAALAVFIKPFCAFVIVGAFLSLAVARRGMRGLVADRRVILFVVATLLPAALYYSFFAIFFPDALHTLRAQGFLPHLLVRASFWNGCLRMVEQTVGLGPFAIALLGMLMLKGRGRPFAAGMCAGYAVYTCAATYHTHTHDYYHLQLVPIVALGLGSVGDWVFGHLPRRGRWSWRVAVTALGLLAIALAVTRYRGQLLAFERTVNVDDTVTLAQRIGGAIGHSRETVFLAPEYGRPLSYYGDLSGRNWPQRGDFAAAALRGLPVPTAEERFRELASRVMPEYFIVTSLAEFESQQDLKQFLTTGFPQVAEIDGCLIFDLRHALHETFNHQDTKTIKSTK